MDGYRAVSILYNVEAKESQGSRTASNDAYLEHALAGCDSRFSFAGVAHNQQVGDNLARDRCHSPVIIWDIEKLRYEGVLCKATRPQSVVASRLELCAGVDVSKGRSQ